MSEQSPPLFLEDNYQDYRGVQKKFFTNLRVMSETPEDHIAYKRAFAENSRLEISHPEAINDAISLISEDIYRYE